MTRSEFSSQGDLWIEGMRALTDYIYVISGSQICNHLNCKSSLAIGIFLSGARMSEHPILQIISLLHARYTAVDPGCGRCGLKISF